MEEEVMSSTTLRFLQLENARMQEENKSLRQENLGLRRYIDSLKSLAWATQQITSEKNLLVLIDQILHSAMDVLNADSGSLLLLDEETDELAFVLVHGDVEEELKGYRIKRDEGIAGWAATRQEPLVVNNPRQDPRFYATVDETFDFLTHSILCVPMVARGKLIGVIELLNKRDQDEFNEADLSLLSILGHVAAIALEELDGRLEAEEAGQISN
jgi:NtrC-family two-component system sensor histidine kinase KinB